MGNCILAQKRVQEKLYIVKSAREKGIGQAGKVYGERKKKYLYRFLKHIYMCVCIYTTQNKQARCLVKPEDVLVPPQKINGQKQLGAPFGQVCCEQNCRNDKQKKELGHPESPLTTCINLVAALHSQLI